MTTPLCERCWTQEDRPKTDFWHSPDYHKENDMQETPVVDALEEKIEAEKGQAGEQLEIDFDGAEDYTISPAADPDDEEEEDAPPNAVCAFLVVVTPDGAAFATSELTKIAEILPQREATVVDMRRACQEVVYDVNAMQTAQQTVGLMQQQAQLMAEEQRSAKIAAKLATKGIHVPPSRR